MRSNTCRTIHSYAMRDVEDFQSEESLPLGFESYGRSLLNQCRRGAMADRLAAYESRFVTPRST